MSRIYLSPPQLGKYEAQFVEDAFASNWIAPLGPQVNLFEREVCERVGVPFGLALSSGTAALHLALKSFGVGPGDSVFCSDLTFIASATPICYLGAKPVFIDAEPDTLNMSPEALVRALEDAAGQGKLPKAAIIVDLYGNPARYERLVPLCAQYGVPVVEDAAEALGASRNGRSCASFGQLSVLSFNGNKIITTSGGGMLLSEDSNVIEKARFWATQARERALHYEHREIGYNYRLSNICAAIGRGQLRTLDARIAQKRAVYEAYERAFANSALRMLPVDEHSRSNYWLSVARLASGAPEKIVAALELADIESRPVWKPMHLQPVFSACPFYPHEPGACPVGEEWFAHGICLPSGGALRTEQIARIAEMVLQTITEESDGEEHEENTVCRVH